MIIDEAMQAAVRHHESGRLYDAEQMYRNVLAQMPEHPDALHLLGLIARRAGQLDAAQDLIRRAIAIDPAMPAYHSNLGLVLMDQTHINEAAAAFWQAIQLAPEFSQAHNNLGVALRDQDRVEESVAKFQRAIQLQPNFAEAYSNLSTSLLKLGRHDEAIAAATTAVQLKPGRLADAHYNMGTAFLEIGRYTEAIDALSAAIAIQPNHVLALTNLGNAMKNLRRPVEAIEAYSTAISHDPLKPDPHWNLALASLQTGDFARGWEEHEWRFACDVLHRPQIFAQPQWRGEPVEGKRILLHPEQGLGDSIQFIRYAPMLASRGAKVVLQCDHSLVRLFQSLPGISVVIARDQPLPEFDLHCPVMSLPLAFATRLESIPAEVPYLSPPSQDRARWQQLVRSEQKQLKVGLAWAGSSIHRNDRSRSMKLSQLQPLGSVAGVQFFSMQKGKESEQLSSLREDWPMVDLADELNDFADTAGLVSQLDLVISVDTSVAHLAGAMGKPVWVLLPFAPDWRWLLDRGDSPWYPTMRLFRQPSQGDWDSVVEQVRTALAVEQSRWHL
jgi:tetratricopeptide (TPR) repeat protein